MLFKALTPKINIATLMPPANKYEIGTYKCRLVYSKDIENIEIIPYVKRVITKLRLIDLDGDHITAECRALDYEFKYEDRTCINSFLRGCGDFTDILMTRNGLITDTSFSNIILFDGKKWITPDTYLLNGIKRRYLLDKGVIEEKKIYTCDLQYFQKISLINAMLEPGETEIDICNVI